MVINHLLTGMILQATSFYQFVSSSLPSGKRSHSDRWNIPIFNRKYIFKGSIFHCYVRLPECNTEICLFGGWDFFEKIPNGGF